MENWWEMPTPILIISLIISFILTWTVGLSVPLLIRYVFYRRPINKTPAIVIVAILFFLQLALWTSLGSVSKSHAVLVLIAYISYNILRKGNKGEYNDDEAYKIMSHSTGTAQQKEAKEWFKKAYSTDNLTLKIEYYTKAIELDPKNAYNYGNRGSVYNKLTEYQKAIDDCTKAIELDPKNAYAYYSNRG